MRYREKTILGGFGAPAIILLLALARFPAFSLTLFSGDTLSVFMAGDAAATFQEPSGFKGSENGFLRATVTHEIDEHLSATVGIRGYTALPEPFLETGALSWENGGAVLCGGYLTSRFGICRYYKIYSTYSPLFENPIIWNTYGFGGTASVHSGAVVLEGGALLNDRESGSVHCYSGIETEAFDAGLLCGFQTYSPEDQDNDLTLGLESSAGNGPVRLHCAMRYLHGFAYSATGTSLQVHGNRFDGFMEARVVPAQMLTFDMIGIYHYDKRVFEQTQSLVGIDCQWRLIRWWGMAGGGEWSNSDGMVSWAPELRTFAVPATGPTQISIGVKRSWTKGSSPLWQEIGNICLVF